jgi:hypothetical protein
MRARSVEEGGLARSAVGVEDGNTSHQVAAYASGTVGVVEHLRFAVSRAGFERSGAFLAGVAPAPAAVVAGAAVSGHDHLTVAAFPAERGYAAVQVTHSQATPFRRSQGTRATTDRLAARAAPPRGRRAAGRPAGAAQVPYRVGAGRDVGAQPAARRLRPGLS